MDKTKEYLPVVDLEGRITGKALREECHFQNKKLLHPVVHLNLVNSKGDVYLQKRPLHKKVQPGKWDTAVGGHVDYGEGIEEALQRECLEEIGLEALDAVFIRSYIWETEIERELVYLYILKTDIIPQPDPYELADGKFWSLAELENPHIHNEFTPCLQQELRMIKSYIA